MPHRSRASALLIVLAVLAVLALFAVSFARLTHVESEAADRRVDEVQAHNAATAGVERALASLQSPPRPWDDPTSDWYYRGHAGQPAGHGTPLDEASLPSFYEGVTAAGRPYSGLLPGTYEPEGDTYVLRVFDAASRIDLNAPNDPMRPDDDQPLVRMLTGLGRAIDDVTPPLTAADALMILAYRRSLPDGEFRDTREILRVPGTPISDLEFEELADFLTVDAWADAMVVAPMEPDRVPLVGAAVYGRVPTGPVRRLPRRPVNVNTAPVEVLIAILTGISALTVDPVTTTVPEGDALWRAVGRAARTSPVSLAQARGLALSLTARRETAPFRHWQDFGDWLDERVAAGAIDALQAAAILANADPNTNTHRANPDAVVRKAVDKFDLVASTTEFCFASMGRYLLESLGRVTAQGGRIRAEALIRVSLEVYSVVRETSESQFSAGTISTYQVTETIYFEPSGAILTEESLELDGGPEVRGSKGSIHANADLDLSGNPWVEGDATATGDVDASSGSHVGGLCVGGRPSQPVPMIRPSAYRDDADFVFGADGVVTDAGGGVVGNGSYGDFTFKKGEWKHTGGQQLAGVLYFEGDVSLSGHTNGTWRATFVATGHVDISGTIVVEPAVGQGISFLAGTDVKLHGNPGSIVSGLLYAGEQMEMTGNTLFRGAAMAKGLGAADRLVRRNWIHGNVLFEYSGLSTPIPIDVSTSDLPTLDLYPDPPAEAVIGSTTVFLPQVCDYDGWIGLGTRVTTLGALGPQPHDDSLLAGFRNNGLDADAGGGALGLVADNAGPRVAPVAGPTAGHLLPDGVYVELDASPAYAAPGNVGPVRGTIGFWLKTSWHGSPSTRRSHHLLALSRTDGVGTQSFQLAHVGQWRPGWWHATGFHYERSTVENAAAQRLVHSTWQPTGSAWHHVAISWDMTSDEGPGSIALYVDGVEIPGAIYEFMNEYQLTETELLHSILTPGNLLRLGERLGNDYDLPATGADATIDEVVSLGQPKPASWAAGIHGGGRYYGGGDAWFRSADQSVPAGVRLLWAAWTVRRPVGHPGPAVTLSVDVGPTSVGSTSDPAGMSLAADVGGAVVYRLVFQGPAVASPLYDSPVVDDVTIAFRTPIEVLSWEQDVRQR